MSWRALLVVLLVTLLIFAVVIYIGLTNMGDRIPANSL
jgi:hypothetical protein